MAGFESSSIPCTNFSTISIVQSPIMFNCFTIKFKIPYVFNSIIDKVVLTLFLGDMSKDFRFYKDKNEILGGEGVKVIIHDRFQISPRIQDTGLIVAKGSEASIVTQPIFRYRKADPYTDCVSDKVIAYDNDRNEVDASSTAHCLTKTWQDIAVKLFNCTLSEIFIVTKLEHLNLQRCKYLSPNISLLELESLIMKTDFFHNISSAINYRGKPKTALGPEVSCKVRCEESFYRKFLSTVPLEGSLKIDLIKIADDKESVINYIKRTTPYMECLKNNISESECLSKCDNFSYKNFIQLNIQQDVAKGAIIERDTPRFSFGDFLAKLAAAVNFWCGFSVIVGFEIIDFLIQVCYSLYATPRKKPTTNNHQLT